MTRRVAVIGGGCSGLACIKCCLDEGLEPVCFESSDDIVSHCVQVYLSARSGTWVISRMGQGGLPADLFGTSRVDSIILTLFPSWFSRMVEKKLNQAFDHKLYGLQPKYRFHKRIPLVNDDLPVRILSGRVQVKPNVKEFRGSSVIFVDGSIVDRVCSS